MQRARHACGMYSAFVRDTQIGYLARTHSASWGAPRITSLASLCRAACLLAPKLRVFLCSDSTSHLREKSFAFCEGLSEFRLICCVLWVLATFTPEVISKSIEKQVHKVASAASCLQPAPKVLRQVPVRISLEK